MPEQSIDHLLDDGIKNQNLTDNTVYQELTSHADLKKQEEAEKLKQLLPNEIFEALLVDHSLISGDFKKQIKSYRIDLNIKQSAWERLRTETNLQLLTGNIMKFINQYYVHVFFLSKVYYSIGSNT